MADAPNDPKADLKARLGLRTRAAAPPSAAPVIAGAPPPPEPVRPPEKPTAETIEAARKKAAEAEKAAGPAVEDFQFGAPERTPLPDKLPQAPQVKYVEVKGAEVLPEVERKRKIMLIAGIAGSALIAFILGRTLAGSSANSELRASIIAEAQEKQALLTAKQPAFDAINGLKLELEKIDNAVRLLDPEKGDITTLEKDFAALIGAMSKFVENKAVVIEPSEAMGERIVNGDLMKDVIALAYSTKSFHAAVVDGLEEAKSLFSANPVPPPDRQTMLLITEPDEREVEGVGKVPLSKGTMVIQPGPPQPNEVRDEAGNVTVEYLQKVKVEGRAEPVLIKTTQLVQLDLQPHYTNVAKASKRMVLARLAVIANRLFEQARLLDPKEVRGRVQSVLDMAEGKKPAATE